MNEQYRAEDFDRQQEEIENETKTMPLIGDKQPIETLLSAYNPNNEQVQTKIKELFQNYDEWRTVRGDGNCFIRGFIFSLCEYLIENRTCSSALLHHVQQAVENSLRQLTKLGYQEYLLEDFYSVLVQIIKDISDNKITTVKQLQEVFVDPNYRDAIVCYMRFLISGYMQLMSDEYVPYVMGTTDHLTVESYCKSEIEVLHKEVDNIIVSAACSSFNVCLRLECLDAQNRNLQQQVQTITFPDQGIPVLTMLYRPGHYDILYKKK